MKKHVLFLLLTIITGALFAQTLTVTPTVTNVTCNGASNGSATIAVSGCTGTPTYVWSPNVSTTNSASNLAPGSYTVNVTTPATGGTQTLFFDDFSTTANWTLNSATGSNGGTANTWVINGASPASGTCSGSSAGGNSLHITCGGGFLCGLIAPNGEAAYNASGAANVTDKSAVITNSISTVGLTNVQVSFLWQCSGEGSNDYGNLRYSTDGGTNWTDLSTIYSGNSGWTCATVTLPPACENISTLKIAFRWRNNGNNAGNDPPMNIDNVSITATGSGGTGCTGSATFTITQPASPLSVSPSQQTNVACNGGNTGSITVAAAGGTVGTGYQYKIGNGSYQNSGTFSNLNAGTYTITALDANNCTATTTITITQPAVALSGSISNQTNATCGNSNGSVTIAGVGGTPSYQYKIGNGSYQNSGTFTNLAPGNYTVTIQDANLCTGTVSVTITSPGNLGVASSNQTNVACFGGNTGSLTVAGSGGTPGYQYKIGTGAYQNSGTFSNLTAGTYTITVLDNAGCTSTTTVTITQPASTIGSTVVSQNNVSCTGVLGSVEIAGTGGTQPYQYQLGSGALQGSGVFNGLSAGNYLFTVYDNNNCSTTQPVTITTISAIDAGVGTLQQITCNGLSNGSVTINATGGTGQLEYSIDGGTTYVSGNTFGGLAAGDYTVLVEDNSGCADVVNFTITEPAPYVPTTSVTGNATLCAGGQLVIDVTSEGSNACAWSNGATGNSITVTQEGVYTVTCTDNNNCTGTSAGINVVATPAPLAAFGYTQIDNYHVQFDNQSVGGIDYTWIFPDNSQQTTEDATYNFPSEGTYNVTLVAEGDCGTDSVTLNILVLKVNGIDEQSVLSQFTMFPNPANGTTILQMNAVKPLKGSLNIMNTLGQKVYTENVSFSGSYTKTLDVSTLSAGIYIITLNTGAVNISRKLVIE